MRKLPHIERGDWQALVEHVRDVTGLKTGPLAARAEVSPETWWRWEKRGQKPKEADVVERFARAFDLEIDDAMWAAGLLIEDQPANSDPRLTGLDPNDPIVQHILELDIDEEMRGFMLERRREIVEMRRKQDLTEIDLLVKRATNAA